MSKPPIPDPRRTLTLRDVSEASGVSEMTVSRVLRRFERDGLLRIKQRDVEITDQPRLEAIALSVLRS